MDWYDYGARFYDPSLGRWHSIDALTDFYPNYNPYNYVENNPVRFIDPYGLSKEDREKRRRQREARKKKKESSKKYKKYVRQIHKGKGKNSSSKTTSNSNTANGLRDFYVGSNSVHYPVWQYRKYRDRVNDGSAPGWMVNQYSRWSRRININMVYSYTSDNVLDELRDLIIFLGDYKMKGVNYNVDGIVPLDLRTTVNYDDIKFKYSLDNMGVHLPKGFVKDVTNVFIKTTGILDRRLYDDKNAVPFMTLRLQVKHK